jgi:aminoglycoside phosphotransferase family enzyme
LAPDVYLGVVPLILETGGNLSIGGEVAITDWLVKMVRLPADRMLDRRLARGDWHYAHIHVLAACLAKFFANARRVNMTMDAYLDRFRAESQASRDALHTGGAPALLHAATYVLRDIEAFIRRRDDLLLQRLEDRRIVEGHGDLRPEHICLGSAPRIIDCLEFRADLRLQDPVEELAFLGMECERLGARLIEPILFDHYCRRTGDCPAPNAGSILPGGRRVDPRPHRDTASSRRAGERSGEMAEASSRVP